MIQCEITSILAFIPTKQVTKCDFWIESYCQVIELHCHPYLYEALFTLITFWTLSLHYQHSLVWSITIELPKNLCSYLLDTTKQIICKIVGLDLMYMHISTLCVRCQYKQLLVFLSINKHQHLKVIQWSLQVTTGYY